MHQEPIPSPQLFDPAMLLAVLQDRRRLGLSIWVWLLLHCWKPSSGVFVRSGSSIRAGELAAALGIGERQARRDLQRLRRAGYVELQNTGRGFRVRLLSRGDE